MKKLLLITLAFLVTTICFANNPVALSLKVKGDVQFERDTTKEALLKGTSLINDDKIYSSDNSFAAIKFIDGSSLLKVFPNSTITISSNKEDKKMNKKINLEKGSVFSSIKKKMGKYEIETPTSVASVKGTKFIIIVDDNGDTIVITLEGEVILKNKKTGEEEIISGNYKGTSNDSGVIVEEYSDEDIDDDIADEIKDDLEDEEEQGTKGDILEIELQKDGDTKTIEIEFE